MELDPAKIAAPTSPEQVPGSTYVPQDDGGEDDAFAKQIAQQARGLATEDGDIMLAMSGIMDGDPIGMEAFDLGFFDDGTPSIRVSGTDIPIEHSQWMALLTQRNQMRQDVRDRMMFEQAKMKAVDSVGRVVGAVPNLPPGLGESLMAQAQVDPQRALQNLTSLYSSMTKDNGRGMLGDIRAEMQEWRNEKSFGFLLRSGEDTVQMVPNPLDPRLSPVEKRVPGQSLRDKRLSELRASNDPHAGPTMLAYAKLEDFMVDPAFRRSYQGNFGIFDRIGLMESDKFSPMSLFERLRHIAAYNGGEFGGTVPLQGVAVDPANPTASPRDAYRRYLEQLDMFAAGAFGYDASTSEALDWMADSMYQIHQSNQALQQPQSAQSQPATATPTPRRQRATR